MTTSINEFGINFASGTQFYPSGVISSQSFYTYISGTLTGGDYAYSTNITISAVDVGSSIILGPNWVQYYDPYGNNSFAAITIKLISPTTVQISSTARLYTYRAIRFQVIQFQKSYGSQTGFIL